MKQILFAISVLFTSTLFAQNSIQLETQIYPPGIIPDQFPQELLKLLYCNLSLE